MSAIHEWRDGHLEPSRELGAPRLAVADSWFVGQGKAFALGLHRERFLRSVGRSIDQDLDAQEFWERAIALIPADGDWFPRVELQQRAEGVQLAFRLRPAPARSRSVVVTTARHDPRTQPTIKGPDLGRLLALRELARGDGAEEAVILSPDGHIVEGAFTAIAWWQGERLCFPDPALDRVDSVTARSLETLARALGMQTAHKLAQPDELEGREVWALNALHGIRIVTDWVDGPQLAEEPGRLQEWRSRFAALAKPLLPE